MIKDYAIIILLFAACVIGFFVYLRKISKKSYETSTEEKVLSIDYLVTVVQKAFSEIMKKDIKDYNISIEEYKQRKKTKAEITDSLLNSGYGDKEAKKFVKSFINDILLSKEVGVTKYNIDKIIPFNNPQRLKSQDKCEILFYYYTKEYGSHGISKMISDNGLDKPLTEEEIRALNEDYDEDDEIHEITADRISRVYEAVMPQLTFDDKLQILYQRIFEMYKGYGVIDPLIDSDIDEIDCGVSGIPEGLFDIESKVDLSAVTYSYESIWIMFHGTNIRFSCLSFGSQQELIRICQNIYRYDASVVLSKQQGRVFAKMKNGSRVLAVRPPFADSYAFFVRKFDSAPSVKPEVLLPDDNNFIPITMSKWLIKGQRNIAITGSQGTGKTTFLKSLIRFIPSIYNLRIQEKAFELNLRYTYPNRNIVSFQETDTISSQEGLNTQKKSNGSVNIIGEVADAEAASWIIQTAKVASLFNMFTHHANTTRNLITSIRDNLMQTKMFSDTKLAEITVAEVLNADIHLEKRDGKRYLERITEIMPINDHSYPSDHIEDISIDEKNALDTAEYRRRITDREQFEVQNLVEYHDGKYYMVNMPSEKMMNDINEKLTPEMRVKFARDMEMLKATFNNPPLK